MRLWKYATLAAGVATLAGATVVAQATINGAGATFPNPIYQKWFAEYNKVDSKVRINYQPVGSGGGIQQVSKRTVFFGATDGPMTNDQLTAADGKLLHFPTVLGGVVPIYNVPGLTTDLKFTGTLLADIFLGKVAKWNDPAIAQVNAGVTLPNADGDTAYPISSFTWLLFYENPQDKAQAKAMVDFMKWALKDGQKFAPKMGYAPLPPEIVDLELKALAKIKIQ